MDDTGFEVSTVDDGGGYDLDEDDDEYEYLALPEVDEEFLDEFKQEDTQGNGIIMLLELKIRLGSTHAANTSFLFCDCNVSLY